MIRRPPRSTLFPTRRSSDLGEDRHDEVWILSFPRLDVDAEDRAGLLLGERHSGFHPNLGQCQWRGGLDRKSTRLNSSHDQISYAVFCLKKKKEAVMCY